jgi:hypothetical protein
MFAFAFSSPLFFYSLEDALPCRFLLRPHRHVLKIPVFRKPCPAEHANFPAHSAILFCRGGEALSAQSAGTLARMRAPLQDAG